MINILYSIIHKRKPSFPVAFLFTIFYHPFFLNIGTTIIISQPFSISEITYLSTLRIITIQIEGFTVYSTAMFNPAPNVAIRIINLFDTLFIAFIVMDDRRLLSGLKIRNTVAIQQNRSGSHYISLPICFSH